MDRRAIAAQSFSLGPLASEGNEVVLFTLPSAPVVADAGRSLDHFAFDRQFEGALRGTAARDGPAESIPGSVIVRRIEVAGALLMGSYEG